MRCCSSSSDVNKKDNQSQSQEVTELVPDKVPEPQSTSAIPESKLLEHILDKLQKKDTYEVFSEPVDPEEVPDYYDFIKNPMDFGTIRKKLAKGVYSTLEQFEKDVFLICSNAMRYNASGTIYYKQARAIQELAKRFFQTLRLDPEKIEFEYKLTPKPKTVYSAKRSTKKAASGRSCFEAAGSDFASGATLATDGNHANSSNASLHDSVKVRIGCVSERPGTVCGYSNGTGWSLQGHNNVDGNGTVVDSKAEQSEELSASMLKMTALKDGRRPLLWEEERRATYKPWNVIVNGNESIFSALGGEPKQLIPIGIQPEYMYARSLARFAAELGPVAWKIAAQKIKKARPSEMPSGPPRVGDYKAASVAFLSREKNRDQPNLVTCGAMLFDDNESRVKFNHRAAAEHGTDDGFVRKGTSEGSPGPSTSTESAATAKLAANFDLREQVVNQLSLPMTQAVGLHSISETTAKWPSDGVKQIQAKSASPNVESNDLIMAGTKFPSKVSQSRLLEIVSRNNRIMQWMPPKQAEGSQPVTSFEVTSSGNFTVERNAAREASDSTKLSSSTNGTNAVVTAVDISVCNYQDGSRTACPPQPTNQDYNVQDINYLANSAQGKMLLGLQQRNCNMFANNSKMLGVSTGAAIGQEDNIVKAWVRSQTADLAHGDASSRIKMQIAPSSHSNTQQNDPQLRPSSSVSQFIQHRMPLDMSSYVQSQLNRVSSQSSSMLPPQTISHGRVGQAFESHGSNRLSSFTHAQTQGGIESSQSHLHPWQDSPSPHLLQQTSDLSHSISSDINVGFQTPKSPVRQSSGMLADSQQPDLALQL